MSWPSGLAYRTQVLVLAAKCGFESRSWHLCPWTRHLTQGLNGYMWGQSWLISPICAVMAAIELYRRISNWASPRTSALKPRLSVSSHNTDARQTIERLTLSSYSACVNTENLVIKPGSAQIDVNFVNLKFVYTPQGAEMVSGMILWALWALWAGVIMRLEHHLVGGYVRYISPHIIIIIIEELTCESFSSLRCKYCIVNEKILKKCRSSRTNFV